MLGDGDRGDVLRRLLVALDLAEERVHALRLDEHADVVEVGDDELLLRWGDGVEVEDVLLDRDVGGDHGAVHGGDHAGEARSEAQAGRGRGRAVLAGVVVYGLSLAFYACLSLERCAQGGRGQTATTSTSSRG